MTTNHRRYHSLDSLRAFLMLLGIVFHASLTYLGAGDLDLWPIRDGNTSIGFSILSAFIHAFRMPTFFLIAGFFGALLYYRRGARGMLENRSKRILLPLLAAWILLNPIIVILSQFIGSYATQFPGVQTSNTQIGLYQYLYHLWFLYDLVYFYALSFLLLPLLQQLPASLCSAWQRGITRFAPTWIGLIILGCGSWLTLLPMSVPTYESTFSLTPSLKTLAGYGFFYVVGWTIYNSRAVLDQISQSAWLYLSSGMILFLIYLGLYGEFIKQPDSLIISLTAKGVLALLSWLLIYGLMGLFIRYLDQPSSRLRYLSDASYWMYLIHLPLTRLYPIVLLPYDLAAIVKFAFVVVATFATCLVSYHFVVRNTWIGYALNGRKTKKHDNTSTSITEAQPLNTPSQQR